MAMGRTALQTSIRQHMLAMKDTLAKLTWLEMSFLDSKVLMDAPSGIAYRISSAITTQLQTQQSRWYADIITVLGSQTTWE